MVDEHRAPVASLLHPLMQEPTPEQTKQLFRGLFDAWNDANEQLAELAARPPGIAYRAGHPFGYAVGAAAYVLRDFWAGVVGGFDDGSCPDA